MNLWNLVSLCMHEKFILNFSNTDEKIHPPQYLWSTHYNDVICVLCCVVWMLCVCGELRSIWPAQFYSVILAASRSAEGNQQVQSDHIHSTVGHKYPTVQHQAHNNNTSTKFTLPTMLKSNTKLSDSKDMSSSSQKPNCATSVAAGMQGLNTTAYMLKILSNYVFQSQHFGSHVTLYTLFVH